MWRLLTDVKFLTWVMVAGGLFLRVWHYVADHTIWYDESVLLVNVMEKDYAGLLGPLHHAVAAPPLFVWLLKSIHLAVGDVSYAWRAVPFLFSVAGLLLTVPLARRVLDPAVAVLAIGMVAVSDAALWLGCCVKPYAGDAAIATALLLYLRASDSWPTAKRLLVLAALTPPAICISYTSMFVIGGLLLATLPAAWKGGTGSRLAWLAASAAAAGTLATLYFGPMKAQRDPNLFREWRLHFPDYVEPQSIPFWLLQATLGVFQEACNPSGFVLGLFAPVGVWALWKSGRREVAIACVGMFALAVAAAAVKAYPFGQHRLSFFLSPAAILLGCAGVQEVIRRVRPVGIGLAVLLFLAADGLALWHLIEPWHKPDAAGVRRYVQQHRQPGDVVLSDDALPSEDEIVDGEVVRQVRGNYLYFFFGELKPLTAGADLSPGGRAWVVMDHHTPEERKVYIDERLRPLGFELVEEKTFGETHAPFFQSAVYLYVKR